MCSLNCLHNELVSIVMRKEGRKGEGGREGAREREGGREEEGGVNWLGELIEGRGER